MKDPQPTPTHLLARIREGDSEAREALLGQLHSELHRIADRLMHHERGDHTLQPTALVNEAWMRLFAGEDFTQAEDGYDLVLDMVGTHSIADYRRALKPDGAMGLVGGPVSLFLRVQLQGVRSSGPGDQELRIVMWRPNKPEDVAFVTELLDAGTIAPVIERSYPLDEVPEAFRRLGSGAVLGKVVISI